MELLDIDIRLTFAILNGKVSAAIYKVLQRNFTESGANITPEQWTVLMYLSQQDGVSQQQLCKATYKDKPSMTRIIDAMEHDHLVERMRDKLDRRANNVHLTRLGYEVKDKALKAALRTLKEALHGLALDDLRVSQEVLRTVLFNATGDKELITE